MDGVPRDSPRTSKELDAEEKTQSNATALRDETISGAMDEGSKFQKAIAAWRSTRPSNHHLVC